ncbi:hypothetical protein HYPSUDRAFT_1023902 [Hypholoma sublateritium FD-334 SS-4]|uniref:Uncharacterized protein n=1 Tax=Hypholoma sublateritium (strain FD-334 SS-4) TaxID=945553 RepID=A0A0D2KRS4_HYPSF|nr:hypothetical protein HYPSUDRAFT_1023902 [Hypholoma sublateritium FD-334 SS-4]
MPVGRSSTLYHKSPRSPAPPTPTAANSRPFLPPSYYAAAGGLSPRDSSRKDGGNPAKRPMDASAKWGPFREHASDTPSESESLVGAQMDERGQRYELHSGIPHLETQLLPSLRDTIDRMTGTPSRASFPFKMGTRSNVAVAEAEKPPRRSRNRRNSPDSAPPVSAKKTYSRLPPVQHVPQPRSYGAPSIVPDIYPHQSTPSTSHLKEPTISALKSSFRSPAPASSSPKPPVPVAVSSPSMAGSSLKSMKSLLSRKCSGTLKSPFNGNRTSSRTARQHQHRLSTPRSTPNPIFPAPELAITTTILPASKILI